jgi:tetratricopeptide (TPR) repeat protein
MQTIFRTIVLSFVATSVFAQQPTLSGSPAQPTSQSATSLSVQAIARAREIVAGNPKDAGAYAALGAALCHQADETSNSLLYSDADEALNKALEISPDNFEAKKAKVCVELGRHEFTRAREQAMILNKRIPDDIMVYGLLVDANSALGNYPEAEDAAQWMLRLRPGNTPAFLHAADLREVFGEQQGALQLLKLVLDASSPADAYGRAVLLTRMARINLEIGELASAQELIDAALVLQPDDPHSLLVMAQLRLQQGRPAEAVQLLRRSYKTLPRSQTLYALAEAMETAKMPEEARTTFAEFERRAVAESSLPDNANRELIFYYADHADRAAKALQTGEQEIARRQDVHTLDAYAWALYKNGRYPEAKKRMNTILKVGTREASIFRHAGEIELKLGNTTRAEGYFRAATELTSGESRSAQLAM